MPPDIIKQIKEKARSQFIMKLNRWSSDGGFMVDDGLDFERITEWHDTLIEETIANIGRELEARCEERLDKDTPIHNQGLQEAITLIRSITGISHTR